MTHCEEKNKYKRAWIWFWYNDVTRFCVLFGIPVIPVLLVSVALFGTGEYLQALGVGTYMFFFGLALLDNDYSNLRRIGMNEYRKKLK